MVRVPRGEYHFIARALDVGAHGRHGADGRHADEAAHIVACTRYPPQGRRGAAFGFAHDDYQGGDVVAKIAALHARTMVIAQIETAEGLANVEAIAAVPGVDALWLGHFDLTNFMGIPAQFERSAITWPPSTAIVARASARQDGGAFSPPTTRWARDYVATGFRLFAYGVDQLMLQQALRAAACDVAARSSAGDGRRRDDER